MISIEIQEWQQLKAKLSKLQQQVIMLKAENQQLKNQLSEHKFIQTSNKSSVNISFGQNIPSNSKSPQSDIQYKQYNQVSSSLKYSQQVRSSLKNQNNPSSNPHFSTKQQDNLSGSDRPKLRKSILKSSTQIAQQKRQAQKDIILEELGLYKQISQKNHQNDILQHMQDDVIIVSRKSYKSIQSRKSLVFSIKPKHEQQNICPYDNIENENYFIPTNSPLPLLQDICVFGPNLQNLQNVTFKHDQNQFVQPCIYYPSVASNSKSAQLYRPYSNYIYPRKVRIKPTQKLNIAIQANKIIFKNSRKQQCNIFIFQAIQSQMKNLQAQVLEKVNPSKWMYGIVMEFNDFVFRQSPVAKSLTVINLPQVQVQAQVQTALQAFSPTLASKNKHSTMLSLDQKQFQNDQIKLQSISLKDIQFQKQKQHMYRSTFSLCVFTYYPFINYFQKLLASIFDQIKLKRIQNLPKTGQLKDCDIFYFIQQLNRIVEKIKNQCSQCMMKMYQQIKIHVGQNVLSLQLKQENIKLDLYDKWAFKILKMMDKDTLYQIYCMIMLQQSVYFVCQDQKTLTFIVFMFAGMLTQPFSYPYPVISVIFSQQLLQTPFTSIIGINESQKWVQKAQQTNLIDLQSKHVVIVTQKQVKIKHHSKYNLPKSTGLKKIFTQFYKKISPNTLSNILLRRNSIISSLNSIPAGNDTLKQNPLFILQFFTELREYFDEHILSFLPNKMTVQKIGAQINLKTGDQEMNKANTRNYLLDQIQKFYKKSNANYHRDSFIKEFIDTQIFSIYLMDEYQIN